MIARPLTRLIRGAIFRSAGSKSVAAARLARDIPKRIEKFIEPFGGSGAATMQFGQRGLFEKGILADISKRTGSIHKTIKSNPEGVAREFENLSSFVKGERTKLGWKTTAEEQDIIKGLFVEGRNKSMSPEQRAALDVLVGNYSWEYIPGATSLPRGIGGSGMYKARPDALANRIRLWGKILEDVDVARVPWQESVKKADTASFLFADPPYLSARGYAKEYGKEWKPESFDELADYIRSIEEGVPGILYGGAGEVKRAQRFPWRQIGPADWEHRFGPRGYWAARPNQISRESIKPRWIGSR